jgi:hypothetical protein
VALAKVLHVNEKGAPHARPRHPTRPRPPSALAAKAVEIRVPEQLRHASGGMRNHACQSIAGLQAFRINLEVMRQAIGKIMREPAP